MERIEHRENTAGKQRQTVGHWLAVTAILALAVAIFFGLHPHYRFVAVGIALIAALAVWKPNWTWWLSAGAMLAVVAFLWTFGPSGYRFASLVPLGVAIVIVLFHFGNRAVKIVTACVAGLICAGTLAVEAPIVASAIAEPEQGAPYVIVLGAAVYGETPSLSLENRVKRAIVYLAENPDTKVVVSGGQGEGEDISEAECMRRYLVSHGIAEDRILMESHSTSTMENLAFSQAVIAADGGEGARVVIVSSGYHLYRAKAMASSLGMDADGAASDDGYPVFMAGMNLREALAVLKMWLFGSWERKACMASVYAT